MSVLHFIDAMPYIMVQALLALSLPFILPGVQELIFDLMCILDPGYFTNHHAPSS